MNINIFITIVNCIIAKLKKLKSELEREQL